MSLRETWNWPVLVVWLTLIQEHPHCLERLWIVYEQSLSFTVLLNVTDFLNISLGFRQIWPQSNGLLEITQCVAQIALSTLCRTAYQPLFMDTVIEREFFQKTVKKMSPSKLKVMMLAVKEIAVEERLCIRSGTLLIDCQQIF